VARSNKRAKLRRGQLLNSGQPAERYQRVTEFEVLAEPALGQGSAKDPDFDSVSRLEVNNLATIA
jgi:hypothetical protein